MTAKRKLDSHVTISTTTTTTETKRVKIDGSDDGVDEGGIQKIGHAITERLRPYEEAINAGDVDVDVGISIDGKGVSSPSPPSLSRRILNLPRPPHQNLHPPDAAPPRLPPHAAHRARRPLDRDYDAVDREVMGGRASVILYAKVMTRHLEALSLFRAYGAEGLKFACAFMMQIALRLFGVEGAPGGVKFEMEGRRDGDAGISSPDVSPEEAARSRTGSGSGQMWRTDKAKRKELYRLFDYHMNRLFKERDALDRNDRRWVSGYAVNLKEMRRRAEEQGLGTWYFSGSITFLEEVEGRCKDGGEQACEKDDVGSLEEWEDDVGSLEEWEDEESEGEDGNEPEEEEGDGKGGVVKEGSRSRSCSMELQSGRSSVEPKRRVKVEGRDRDDSLFC